MAKKTDKEDVKTEVPVVTPTPAVAKVPESKAELLALYETLKSLGITQIGQLEQLISRAE